MLFKSVMIHVVIDTNAQIHFKVWLWFGVRACSNVVCWVDVRYSASDKRNPLILTNCRYSILSLM
jgi:hypothetical protein